MNIETKPQITLNLSPILEAYCRFVFCSSEKQPYIVLSRRQDIGKLIFAHIMSGDFQSKRPFIEHPVKFILPMPNNEHGYWLRYRYIFFPKWAEQKIIDGIEYEFRAWVRERFSTGYELNYDQKTIVNAILRGLNVRNNVANFDAIKKIDYRNKRSKEENLFKMLLKIERSEE